MTPEEVTAVMAAHEGHWPWGSKCMTFPERTEGNTHCEPYRLAEALAASEAKVARVVGLANWWAAGRQANVDTMTRLVAALKITDALAAQPEQAANYRRSVDA